MRLLVTVANDIPKIYRARVVILGAFWRFRFIVLDVGGARRFRINLSSGKSFCLSKAHVSTSQWLTTGRETNGYLRCGLTR